MIAHTALIKDWMERWAAIDCAAAQAKAKRRRKVPKVKRLSETTQRPGAPIEEKRLQQIHEKPMTAEELDSLAPVDKAWVINHELTPAQREELGVKSDENVRPEGCTCGTGIDCSVCNG
jgi:hypothetical protein